MEFSEAREEHEAGDSKGRREEEEVGEGIG